jgi:ubiquinone/menaquinone biosynthesis C-methylase UbiE
MKDLDSLSNKEHWDRYWREEVSSEIHEELLRQIFRHLDVKGQMILEVGAGGGLDSIALAEKGAKVIALDYSSTAIDKIARNAAAHGAHLCLVIAEAHNLPFANDSFDLVFHQGLLEHFANPLKLLLEQTRVIKKGRYILVDVPQTYNLYTIEKCIAMRRGRWFTGWEREFSIRELESLLKTAGFALDGAYGWGYYPALFGWLRRTAWLHRRAQYVPWFRPLVALLDAWWRFVEDTRLPLYYLKSIGAIGRKN